MATKADEIMADFVTAGYTEGSLADRGMALLIDKGATEGSLADRQVELGELPKEIIDPNVYP